MVDDGHGDVDLAMGAVADDDVLTVLEDVSVADDDHICPGHLGIETLGHE